MPNVDLLVEAGKPFSVSEAAAVADAEAKRINRFIDTAALPEYTFRKNRKGRSVYAFACPIIRFYSSEAGASLTKAAKREVAGVMAEKLQANWDMFFQGGNASRAARQVAIPMKGCDFDQRIGQMVIELNKPVKEALDNLELLALAESRVVVDSDYRGGIPVIRGTRVSPYEAAGLARVDGIESALEDYPNLTPEDFEMSLIYAKAYPPRRRPVRKDGGWRRNNLAGESVATGRLCESQGGL